MRLHTCHSRLVPAILLISNVFVCFTTSGSPTSEDSDPPAATTETCDGHDEKIQYTKGFADWKSKHESCSHKKTVEIISVDSRPLEYTPQLDSNGQGIKLDQATFKGGYNVLCAAVNYLYAKRHQYTYRYISLDLKKNKEGGSKYNYCEHPLHGRRAAPWCKLLGIYDRIKHRTADEIMFMDTDAMFWRSDRTLENAYNEQSVMDSADAKTAPFIVATDFPFNQLMAKHLKSRGSSKTPMIPTCTAVMVFRPSPTIDWMMSQWWNTASYSEVFSNKFPFEQGTLNWGLLRHDHFRQKHTSIINWRMMDKQNPENTNYIRHVHSGMNSSTRYATPIFKLKSFGITTSTELDTLLTKIRETSVLTPNISRLEEQLSVAIPGMQVSLPLDCCEVPLKMRNTYCFQATKCPGPDNLIWK